MGKLACADACCDLFDCAGILQIQLIASVVLEKLRV